ncbi:flavodoxin domain-containing protein [Rhodococcus rhodochrous]|uniref:Flavodoxin domain-containing protein n=1 Tax=Rhodococcus rhodochrous KG-21 TaxID=1441923 RepID=A0A0M8PC22_RHORH|nr:flavodoxin domain-containing protein [Rhodococcus rhodochrous]KOS53356.1 hypothetical protein Z051_25980 [Rhodococcus rhodochrous KG-21]
MKVLVAYTTAYGATRGVAERIAQRLTEAGHEADLCDLAGPVDPSAHAAVVLGSSVHNGQWLAPAARFADLHRAHLAGKPAWLFSVQTVGTTSAMISARLARWVRPKMKEPKVAATLRATANVREYRAFAGAIEPEQWPGIVGRVVFRLAGGRYGDHRDWADVDAFAARIVRNIDRP